MTEIFGYIAAFVMGLTLGSIGGGGSILTVPILVYLLGVPPVTATGYSLLIVGAAAAFGAWRYHKRGMIPLRDALVFALPSIAGVYLSRAFLMPAVPDPVFSEIGKDFAIMVLFAVLMVVSAVMMLRNSRKLTPLKDVPHHPVLIVIEGLVVGIVTGILGAGGGFLIIPVLVLLLRLPMRQAVGTSLMIVASKSLLGFLGDIQNLQNIDWWFLIGFCGLAAIGLVVGVKVAKYLPSHQLKKAFGWMVLVMGVFILGDQLLRLL